jgi:hypothetical protein
MKVLRGMVLWHYFDRKGRIVNASITKFEHTEEGFSEWMGEVHAENEKLKARRKGISVPHQIIFSGASRPG